MWGHSRACVAPNTDSMPQKLTSLPSLRWRPSLLAENNQARCKAHPVARRVGGPLRAAADEQKSFGGGPKRRGQVALTVRPLLTELDGPHHHHPTRGEGGGGLRLGMEMRLQTWPCGMGQRRRAALERKTISESDRIYSVTVGGHINWAKDGGTATEKCIRRGQVRRV